jgi:hypothetical protein
MLMRLCSSGCNELYDYLDPGLLSKTCTILIAREHSRYAYHE